MKVATEGSILWYIGAGMVGFGVGLIVVGGILVV